MPAYEEFRDPGRVRLLLEQITPLAEQHGKTLGRPLQIMEICGGHTHAIFRFGLDQLLPDSIEFIHGPGCPVCVLPREAIDQAVQLAMRPGTILASFGDPLRVSGSQMSLLQAKARGADVRILYSPIDAIDLARANPDKQVVFFAIGFDTTMPSIAKTLLESARQDITNLSFLCHHIRLLPTMEALLQSKDIRLDGFIGPGHVSMVIGADAYQPIADVYKKPLVIAGFEPVDFLQALLLLVRQLADGRCEIENAYARVVSRQGNVLAQQVMDDVFEPEVDACWRGLGEVKGSGVRIRPAFRRFDGTLHLEEDHQPPTKDPCYCQQVLTGQRKPNQCPLFGQGCTPESAQGALMVSSEGACAAYYQYRLETESSNA